MLALVVAVVLFTSYTAAVEAAAVEAAAALGSRTTTSLAKIAKDVLDHIQIEKEKTSLYFTTLKDRVEDIYRTMTHGRQDSVTIGDEIRTSVDLALEYMVYTILYTIYYTLYTIHYTLRTTQYTLCTIHYRPLMIGNCLVRKTR